MINCIILKSVGDFKIAKNLSITTKQFSSGKGDGLQENESMTRIKEHPSYKIPNKLVTDLRALTQKSFGSYRDVRLLE